MKATDTKKIIFAKTNKENDIQKPIKQSIIMSGVMREPKMLWFVTFD